MRPVFKSYFIANIGDFTFILLYYLVCFFKPFPDKPFLRSYVAYFGKVALKGRQATACIGSYFLKEQNKDHSI